MDTRTNAARLRIEQLRQALVKLGVHALLVPSADPHLSEYLPERWQTRQWLSGFTGSMGTLVVAPEQALLFADSRYWEQAERELAGSGIELVKMAAAGTQAPVVWLAEHTPRSATVAVDGDVTSLALAASLRAALEPAGVKLRTDLDPVDSIWPKRPALPAKPVYEHEAAFATQSRAERLAEVRAAMAAQGASHHLISTLDDLAWLTNLRGSDVSYNPVFLAHMLLSAEGATLFVGAGKIGKELQATLAQDGVQLADYAGIGAALAALGEGSVLLVDPKRVTHGIRGQAGAACRVIENINPSTLLKSRKSDADAAHVRKAMAEDGAAMCHFYAWFEAELAAGRTVSELTVDERLSAERAKRPGFVGLSFSTIAGFNANGALPHYRALPDAFAVICGTGAAALDGLLLIDSGGQYLGGTTDITRVWPIGQPSGAMKRDYTLVLKGTLNLSRARFPRGTPGPMLDALARAPLWQAGIDFGHGTGHGVGYFLNVHEGPQSISKAVPVADAHMGMEPGMITSIEPGVYRPGKWGVRIENLVLTVPTDTPEGQTFAEFLEFETLTLCPIDTRCIERSLLRDDEVQWLNAYHASVRARLKSMVDGAALDWLMARTEPL